MSDDIINFYKNTSFTEEPIKEKVITKEIKSVSVEIPEDDPLQDVFRTLVENLQKTKASEFNKPIEEIIEESNDEPFTKFLNNVASIIKQDDRLQTDEQIKEAAIGVINKIKDEDLTFTEEKKTKNSYVPAKFLKSYPKKISSKVPVIESKDEVKNKKLVVEEVKESTVKNVYVNELITKDNRIRKPSTTDKPADLKTLVEKKVREEIDKFSQHFAQISMTAGGGGSVAVQYADGGTMRGNLNVTGKYLSGGRDLSTIFSGGGGGGNQTLSFNSNTAALSISNGNTVSLSTLITDLSATTLKVYDNAVTYTIALSDNNSAIHLDTTSASISALFPSNLTEGFSVALMNTGTNILYLSAAIPLRSLGNGLSGLYSGAFTYIHNGAVYAVGRF
jgi:hypothetical protein